MSFYVCPGANRYARALLLGSQKKIASYSVLPQTRYGEMKNSDWVEMISLYIC